jgi:NAD+ kinase
MTKKIAFTAARQPQAQEALKRLKAKYSHVPASEADVVVALGGDGFMLRALHRYMNSGVPIYGMNRGSVGFLLNSYSEKALKKRIRQAVAIDVNPLAMTAVDVQGKKHSALAINEVSLLRETRLAAKINIKIDGIERLEGMICDGVLLSTPAGSTGYNLSAHGPIVPLGAGVLALTPISAFRPRQWRGALLPHDATVTFEILNPEERMVSAVADYTEFGSIASVTITEDRSKTVTMLHDLEHNFEERILKEQFLT